MNAVTPFVAAANAARLGEFVDAFGRLLDATGDEAAILDGGAGLLAQLVARDDWLPAEYDEADPARYRQYLLHLDPRGRFSVVSFVWGPGQATPIHDHRVWGLVGVLRGSERNQAYARGERGGLEPLGAPELLGPGAVAGVSPRIGDIHSVANARADRVSISIHVYGGDIGGIERATYDLTGRPKRFISGYANRSTGPVAMSAAEVRAELLARREIALLDLRDEAAFAAGHPLFAAQLPPDRIEVEAAARLPRRSVPVVLYDDGAGLVAAAAACFAALGYTDVRTLMSGLQGWRDAGYELFEDVNSYSKAFGELVEAERRTPSIPAADLRALIDERADIAVVDARRFDEYRTMSIPAAQGYRVDKRLWTGLAATNAHSYAADKPGIIVEHFCAKR